MRDRTSPALRATLVGAGALALLALVALASRGGLGGGGSSAGKPSQRLLSYALSVLVVVYVAAAPFALWAFVVQRHEEAERAQVRGRRGARLLVNALVLLAFVAAALGLQRLRHAHPKPLHPTSTPGQARGRARPGTSAPAPPGPSFRWPVAAVAAALAAAAVAAYLGTRRRQRPERPRSAAAEELARALDDALADVLAEAEPRRAVIKAYARMEAVLAAQGLPRRQAEAPFEYLARALRELDASAESVARLTELFERAKFSLHEIDAAMRSDAIAALAAVRAEVTAA